MRPFVTACAVLALAAGPLSTGLATAQDWLREAIPLENRTHDFGNVARAANTEHRFELKNVLESDIHIRGVRASCGCTTPIVEDEWIKPGESGTILARFNTGTFTGGKSATLTVSIDKPYFTELQLNVRGYIRSDVVLNPGEVNFGEIPQGEPKSVDVVLDYAGRNDWQVLEIQSPQQFVKVQFEELSRNAGRIQYKIVAAVDPLAPIGQLNSQFVIKTNDRNRPSVPVCFALNVQSPVQVSPQVLTLGKVRLGESNSQRLVIKAREAFRILDIRSEEAEVRFETSEAAKTAHLLNLNISPLGQAGKTEGPMVGSLLLYTDLLDEPLKIELNYELENGALASESVAQVD